MPNRSKSNVFGQITQPLKESKPAVHGVCPNTLPLAISALLLSSAIQAEPSWECQLASNSGWKCTTEKVAAKEPPSAPPLPGQRRADTFRISTLAQADAAGDTAEPKTSIQESVTTDTAPAEQAPSSRTEEKRGGSLNLRIDQNLDWQSCSGPLLLNNPRELPQDDAIHILADAAVLRESTQDADFSGSVSITRGATLVEADKAHYDRQLELLDTQGSVFFERTNMRMTSDSATFNLATDQGHAEGVEYRLLAIRGRGSASTADISDKNLAHLQNVSYTTCNPDNSDWLLSADKLDIDRKEGTGTARHAKLTLKNVPIFYSPYLSFPIDDRRKSGFLAPSLAVGSRTGIDITTPYYFNIAPQMDATLTPRLMSKRGVMVGGEFRHLGDWYTSTISAEVLANDREREDGENSLRDALSIQASAKPADRWQLDTDINYVSDKDYVEDFGTSLAVNSNKHLERRGDVRYQGDGWNFLGRMQYYQTIDESIADTDRPYQRMPQLLVDLNRPNQAKGLTYLLHSEYANFRHSDDEKVQGHRVDIFPGVSLPMRRSWGFLTPKLSARYTAYSLDNQTLDADSNPGRGTATVSVDSGLFFDRPISLFGQASNQTLEPRLFYAYTPRVDQDELPNFDSSAVTFGFSNMFRENGFNGADRVEDANRISAALTSRTLTNDRGTEILRGSVGTVIFLDDREVSLTDSSPRTQNTSSIFTEMSARITPLWRTKAEWNWDPHESETEKGTFSLQYNRDNKRIANFGYRYVPGSDIDQSDISGRWPVTHGIHLVGRWNYAINNSQTMEAFGGVEYDSCCWRTRLVARNYRTGIDGEANNMIYFQIELKGLTDIGNRVDSLLEQGILGYNIDRGYN